MQQIRIETVGDLAREVRTLLSADRKWLFRGQPDARWELLPSVHRGYTQQQERYLTNEFRVRARSRYSPCPADHDYPGWLALMQHYGLPTRLLDWTYSPLVAAFFAVHPDYVAPYAEPRRDACVWALAAGELNQSQGFEPLIFPLDAASYQPLIVPAFKNRDEPNTVGVAMAIEHDPRIQLQQGAFTVHSCRTPLDRLPGSERLLRQLVIPCAAVAPFCEELSLLGMRKSNLFPDLGALTSELKSMHRPADAWEATGPTGRQARVLDLAESVRRTHPAKENQSMEEARRNEAQSSAKPAETQGEGLEKRNVTGPAPVDEASREGEKTQEGRDDNLENLNVTRPNPPPTERATDKTA